MVATNMVNISILDHIYYDFEIGLDLCYRFIGLDLCYRYRFIQKGFVSGAML